ncbi:hypothetical protein X474_02215 [Dethiosulfatarculus sandiegensis]|uniref:Uncharacterized protein n=1 Tax=Dethiosulfatarculus sandiegensis TaxID=1429043 RepID=A0A0D2JC12_9BACT|nr:hypothetical protein X474_02215 [Dethiosulfatarculus sandiegensis]
MTPDNGYFTRPGPLRSCLDFTCLVFMAFCTEPLHDIPAK